jgi:hypothetical protein
MAAPSREGATRRSSHAPSRRSHRRVACRWRCRAVPRSVGRAAAPSPFVTSRNASSASARSTWRPATASRPAPISRSFSNSSRSMSPRPILARLSRNTARFPAPYEISSRCSSDDLGRDDASRCPTYQQRPKHGGLKTRPTRPASPQPPGGLPRLLGLWRYRPDISAKHPASHPPRQGSARAHSDASARPPSRSSPPRPAA